MSDNSDTSSNDIDYLAIANAVWDGIHVFGPNGRLTRDDLDAILATHGVKTARPGTLRRDTWNYARRNHRQRFNRVLAAQHGVTLEIMSPTKLYGLVTSANKLIGDPFLRGQKFYRQIMRELDHVRQIVESHIPPPPGLNEEGLQRWQMLNRRKFERLMADYFDSLEQNTLVAGLQQHVPQLSDNVVDLREGRMKQRRVI